MGVRAGLRPSASGVSLVSALAPILAAALAHGHAVEAVLDIEPPHGGRRDGAGREPAVGNEGAQDERDRSGAVLLADVEEELPLLGRKFLRVAPVAARRWSQGGEAAFERRHRVAPVVSTPGGRKRSWRKCAQGGAQLAVVEILARERADDLAAEDGDGLGVVLRREGGCFGLGGAAAEVDGSISAPPGGLAGSGDGEGGAVPSGRSGAEGSSMVGPPPLAPPRRWTSAYMPPPRGTPPSRWRALPRPARTLRASSRRGPRPGAA